MSSSQDRRILRTQKKLKAALIHLLKEGHDLRSLSVMEVAQQATCNRVTFYSHYKDVDDLLCTIFDDYLTELLTYFRESYQALGKISATDERLHLAIFEYIYQNQFIFSLIIKGEILPGSQNRFCDSLVQLTGKEIALKDDLPIEVPALSYYSTYASLGFFIYWMNQDVKEKPEVMAKN
ncbi:TetR/AcrR family transcriptional regulator [Kurthia sp. FSL E2-0154]|uniref:TetR/AcrR family transcriptional regulator n=1 Tax=Kurthia sp. FSL E2-0154 TaxID=2921358 RepID=UPI0030FCE349